MRSRPADVDESQLRNVLSATWRLEPESLEYSPVGGGSYHWIATQPDGARHFVTVDDLDSKTWLGRDRDSAFDGLRRSYETALMLRDKANLDFVVAPVPDPSGSAVVRLDSQFAIAVFPFIDGERLGLFEIPAADRAPVIRLFADLHQASSEVGDIALTRAFELPARAVLDSSLADLTTTWTSGPFGERARQWLATNADRIVRKLELYRQMAGRMQSSATVITHGEPHAGNMMRADGRLLLIDWDTVALAPAERDLWLACGSSMADSDLYTRATGRQIDKEALRFYALAWQLTDIGAFISVLQRTHHYSEDTEHAWNVLSNMSLDA